MRCTPIILGLAIGCTSAQQQQPPACDAAACAAEGNLCEADVCVEPWHAGSPVWSRCAGSTRATAESLATKAQAYDARELGLHVHPQMPWLIDVTIAPGTDPTTATWHDVVAWRSGENDGLWTGLALAGQAYRYAVTHDPEARAAVATLLDGEQLRMRITGVPGLFTRQLIPPGITGLACPTDLSLYIPTTDKRGNRWVRIGDDGCIQTSDGQTFQSSTHCGLVEFAGWCWLDNISQDEYSGHLFGLGAVARLVDDPALRAEALDLLSQVGTHLATHGMEFIDWDGRPTQWGKLHPDAPGGDSPGYLAILGRSFLVTAARGTGDRALASASSQLDWDEYLDQIDVWFGSDGCGANWNDLSMLTAAFHHLLWNERDPDKRASVAAAFERVLVRPANTRGILAQKNAWYDLMWAAQKPLGPGSDGPAYAAVEDAVCQLREFPASNHVAAHATAPLAPEVCTGRQDESLAATAFGAADRCAATFQWWGNPYIRGACSDEPTIVQQPTGYLLPYWMGRYYGFIAADQ